MEATTHAHHEHHDHPEMPTSGRALSAVALSATLHCLTGCAIGEVLGMIIGTALGFSDVGTIALAVALAFLFGYSLTSLPLLRAGLALGAVIPIAFASDTISIAIMEIVDNAIMVAIPGAMEAGVGDLLFWGALSVALVIAGAFAFPANRWLIARGKGHTAVHETGIHGGPPVKVVGAVAAVAAVFGTVVLLAEAFSGEDDGHGGGHAAMQGESKEAGHGGGSAEHGGQPDPVRGLSASSNGMTLRLATTRLEPGERGTLRFSIVGSGGQAVRDFEVEHERRLHLILARHDLTGFQHLHPRLRADGSWTTAVTIAEPGSYRVFADFKRDGRNETLATDLTVAGRAAARPLPAPSATATTADGYEVAVEGTGSRAGEPTELSFTVSRNGEPVEPEPYLGAGGHLVALREGDLAYLHVHPSEGGGHGAGHGMAVSFDTEFPSADSYRLFLQFKHEGKVHTAAFTRAVER
jgi:Domain of unknown function (DUF4396)